MKIESIDIVTYPIEQVYQAIRDELPKLAAFLPNVEFVEVLERKEPEPGIVDLVNKWQGTSDNVPSIARPFLKKEMLAWKDIAHWVDAERSVSWYFETFIGSKLFDCRGTNYFTGMDDKRSEVKITGDIIVHGEQLPGVPKFLAKKVAPVIEKYLVNQITPNLKGLAAGLQRYLDAKTKGA